MSRGTALPTRLHVHPEMTQISLWIRGDQSLSCPLEDALEPWLPMVPCADWSEYFDAQSDLRFRWADMQSCSKYCLPAHLLKKNNSLTSS